MLTLFIAISPFALFGFVLAVWFAKEEIERWWYDRKSEKVTYVNGYDVDSPLVKRFQYLAGIRGDLYTTYSRGSLRDRFNRLRSTGYHST